MLTFAYNARDPLGKMIQGTLEVETREDAVSRLKREGLHVLNLEEESEAGDLMPRRVSKSDIIYVTSQLAIMVETGITLSVALDSIAQQETNATLKKVLMDLRLHVEAGGEFSSVLAQHPKYFDKTYVALIKAAEQTGTLGQMLDTVANYLRSQLETRQKIRAAMAYPSIMATLAVGVTIFLLTYILPKFQPLFTRKGMKLPGPTVVMIAASEALIDSWYLWLAGAVGLVIAFLVGRKTDQGRQIIDWMKLHLPIIGTMYRKITISRSIRTLGTMVASGVSMLDAIRLTAEVSNNYYFEQIWMRVLDSITQGNRIVDTLSTEKLMPATLVQMIGAGEETGKLDTVLAKVSSYYDREVETSLKATTSLIEPLMICGMGFIVGGIALGLLMPIFQLSRPG